MGDRWGTGGTGGGQVGDMWGTCEGHVGDISQVPEGLARNAPPALLRFFGGPTANLSRFPWSGGPTLNLSRFPSLGWSCGYSLVFSGVLVVLRSISRVFRGLVVLR